MQSARLMTGRMMMLVVSRERSHCLICAVVTGLSPHLPTGFAGAEPLLDLCGGDGFVSPPADGVFTGEGGVGDVEVHHDLATGGADGDLTGVLVGGEEVQCQVTTRDRTHCLCSSGVEGTVVAETSPDFCFAGDGLVEVVAVGNVDHGGDERVAVLVDVGDVAEPVLSGFLALCLGSFGVEPEDRLGDESVELVPAHIGDGGELAVDECCGVLGEGAGGVGDAVGLVRRDPARDDGGVERRESPGAFDDASDVHPTPVGGATQDRDEFHQRELTDQWSTQPGDRNPGVHDTREDGRCALDGLDDVLVRPCHDRDPFADLGGQTAL
ncbi:hypothetical protein ASE01_10080 [Nocardioides sp. Root190]|nr:hypothetical protein ASE01_10080 [Nocardioides sp. Root190]